MSAKKPSRRVTSADVARESGLSRATVSFVLNDKPNQSIPPATRERVLQAAARLGYIPYAPARTLRSGRSDIVLLVLPPWPLGPAMNRLVDAAAEVLTEAGLTLVAHIHLGGPERLASLNTSLAPAAVFGMQPFTQEEQDVMRRAGVGLILPQPPPDHDLADTPWSSGVGRMQAEHLIARGHEQISYALPDDPRLAELAHSRLDGVARACTDAGLAPPLAAPVPLDADQAARTVSQWRDSPTPPTAVCAYNDEVALALLAGMRNIDLSAPDDLAVIGSDDIPAAAFAVPPLTTVALDSGSLGADLAHALQRSLDGDPEDFSTLRPSVHVIERRST
ncbi:LacI family DNA-binding transcriptional regulator [Spirillospora sp. NPDC052242]